MLPPSWKAELVIFTPVAPAADETIAANRIVTAPPVIDLRIVGPPIEITLNRQN
jgi:hypothetical protein